MLRNYYTLTKPGIVYGNLFSMLAGFFFAAHTDVSVPLLFAAVVGLGLVIASACVFNNYFDRSIDQKMERTKHRALVTGAISVPAALTFGLVLGVVGFGLLYLSVNAVSAVVAAFGFFAYLVLYGYAKRATHWGTMVGSISGAVSIVVGYTSVTGRLDLTALMLFAIMVFWQMPHFYAIAIYRGPEYKAAGIPVLPLAKGLTSTKRHMVGFILAYLIVASFPTLFGYTGLTYLFVVLFCGLRWLFAGWKGFHTKQVDTWARGVFKLSLVILVTFSIALAAGPLLP